METKKFNNITVKDLVRKIFEHKHLFIVDARKTDDFDDWKVEGKNVEILNVPYAEVKESGIGGYLEKLPDNEDIYVICAKGGSSQKVAQMIVDAGYSKVFSVEGGMNAWSEHLEPIKIGELTSGGSMFQFVRIGKGCLSYLIESNGEAAIIDTNRMLAPYEAFISDRKLAVTHVLDTHLHADHISGGRKIAQKYGATYFLPPKDAEEVTFEFEQINDGDEYEIGGIKIRAFYSPGHTIGSTSFIVDDKYLLTGDILFIDSVGRPDLAGKAEDWVGDLRDTLYKRYKELTDELLVLPAHYMSIKEMNDDGSISAKLGVLYDKNQGLNIKDEGEFRKKVTENLPPQPNSYEQIRETNMGKLSPEEEKQREMETGPNRCAVS